MNKVLKISTSVIFSVIRYIFKIIMTEVFSAPPKVILQSFCQLRLTKTFRSCWNFISVLENNLITKIMCRYKFVFEYTEDLSQIKTGKYI